MRRSSASLTVLGVLALGASAATAPVEQTEASWTHEQPARSADLVAATVPPVASLSCTGSLLLGRLTINWAHPSGSLPREGYQIQRFASASSTTPTHTFTVGPNATQYVNSNLSLLSTSRWEVRTMGPGEWVSAPWAMQVTQLATALNCTPESEPRS
ncbi:hypothetical protein [Nesterenkonia suensis]